VTRSVGDFFYESTIELWVIVENIVCYVERQRALLTMLGCDVSAKLHVPSVSYMSSSVKHRLDFGGCNDNGYKIAINLGSVLPEVQFNCGTCLG